MEKQPPQKLRKFFGRLFLANNNLPAYLTIFQQMIQFLTYLSIIYGYPSLSIISKSSSLLFVSMQIVLLMTFLVFRYIKGTSLIGFIYLVVIYNGAHVMGVSQRMMGRATQGCTLVLILMDVLGSVNFQFSNFNIASQDNNICKIMHYLAMVSGVLSNCILDGIWAHLPPLGLFAVLILTKDASMCKNNRHKQFLMRAYLFIFVVHVTLLVTKWLTLPLWPQILTPFVLSQAIYQLRTCIKNIPALEQLISQQKYLKLAFTICSYLYSRRYQKHFQQQLQHFMGQDYQQIHGPVARKQNIYARLIGLLQRRPDFYSQLLAAQVYIHYDHNLLKAKLIIQKLKTQTRFFQIFHKAHIHRLQQLLHDAFCIKYRQIDFQYYDDYYLCDQLRTQMLKTAAIRLSLWQYACRSEVLPNRMKQLADRLVSMERKTEDKYRGIGQKCVTVSLLYVAYLFEVRGDVLGGKTVLEQLAFNQDFQVNMLITQKVFMVFSLQQDPLTMVKVSPNVSAILGYQRSQVQNQQIQIFLPTFFHKSHRAKTLALISGTSSTFYLYNRRTLVKNSSGYYQQCNVVVRLHLGFGGQMKLCGYLQVRSMSRYSWQGFLFVDQQGRIVQCGESMQQMAPAQGKYHSIGQFFQGQYSPTKQMKSYQYFGQNDFVPIAQFGSQEGKVTYFVKLQRQRVPISDNRVNQMLQSLNSPRLDIGFVSEYQNKRSETQQMICSKQYCIWGTLFLAMLIVVGILSSKGYQNRKQVWNEQQQLVNLSMDMYRYYNLSSNLGMDISYYDMNSQYGYLNVQVSNHFRFIKDSLDLQVINQKFNVLSFDNYLVVSTLPNIIYNKTNYQLIKQITANSYMLQLFKDDPFVMDSATKRMRSMMRIVFFQSYGQYRSQVRNTAKRQLLVKRRFQELSLNDWIYMIIRLSMILLMYAMVVRVQHKMRQGERLTLSLIVGVRNPHPILKDIRHFIHRISHQQPMLAGNVQQSAIKASKFKQSGAFGVNGQASKTEMSFRDYSGRNFLQQSANRSAIGGETVRVQPVANKMQFIFRQQELPSPPRRKTLLFLPLLLLLLLSGAIVANVIVSRSQQIDIQTTFKNILTMSQPSVTFSRIVISYLNTINRLQANTTINIAAMNRTFSSFPTTQPSMSFSQRSHREFDQFIELASKLQFQYMCRYIQCDGGFASQIDIIAYATMQKMIRIINSTLPMLNINTIRQDLDIGGRLKNKMDLLIYTQGVVSSFMQRIINTYSRCFTKFKQRVSETDTGLYAATWIIWVLALILYLSIIVWAGRSQWLLVQMSALVNTNSYKKELKTMKEREQRRMGGSQNGTRIDVIEENTHDSNAVAQ